VATSPEGNVPPSPRGVFGEGLRVLGRAIREQRTLFGVAVVGSILFATMTIASAYVVGAVVGRVVVPALAGGHVATGALAAAAATILGVSLLKVFGILGRRLGAGAMQFRLQADYRRRVTRRYLRLPLSWHHRHATGTLLSNANADVEATWFPIAPLPFAVGTLVMLVVAAVALLATDWVLALVGFTVFPALFTLNIIYSRRMSPRISHAQQLRAEVSAIAHESFDGALIVKTMGREAEETERFAARTTDLRDALVGVGRVRGLFDPIMDALPNLGTLAVLVVGAARLRAGAVSVADVVSVAFLFSVLAFPVRAVGWVLGELPRSVVGWRRVSAVLEATGDARYGERRPADTAAAALRFEGVSYAYPDAEPVLHEVSFEVPAGRTVALVGPTGSGKSTIAALAARLVDPDSGRISLDGYDLRDLDAGALARSVALVSQVPFVFDDTVAGNVTLDRDGVDEAAVRSALELAQATGFVDRLADGLDTTVGERGTSLSGGQRQRLTLARALAGGPRLLVLDDATSAVDPRVEAAILAALRRPAPAPNPPTPTAGPAGSSGPAGPAGHQAASILVVAYRRATIALADEVVYVENGRVLARGAHRELLATVPGYAALVTAYERADAEREREHAFDTEEVPA
jgi:ATP-binding cassette subfamily B protein